MDDQSTKAAPEYWRWAESRYTNPELQPNEGTVITAGVDVGSVSSQAVVLVDGEIYCYGNMRTGSNSEGSARSALDRALEGTGLHLEDIHAIVGTGYGRVNVPFATKTKTEIACHARGGNAIYGSRVRTILDMGGQDCKVMHLDEKGKVQTFLMNDKCAAGTGRGMEVFADLLGVHIEQVGPLSLRVKRDPPPVSSTCVVFAKSEASSLLRKGWSKEEVLAAYCLAMAKRVVALIRRIGVREDFAITGGIGKNPGVVQRIAALLNVTPLKTDMDTQVAGALGAALFAKDWYEKKRR